MMMRLLTVVGLVWFGMSSLAPMAAAGEISLLSGIYKQEEYKAGGSDAGGESEFSVGGRFLEMMDDEMAWFAGGSIILRSYDAPSGTPAPDNSTSIDIGGGTRLYFQAFTEGIVPYAQAYGAYRNVKDVTPTTGGYTEVESSGLFYGIDTGLRFGLGQNVFIDLELNMFDSDLWVTEKTEVYGTNATTNNFEKLSDSETTRIEVFGETTKEFNQIKVAFGMVI